METTGLDSGRDSIIELGAVRFEEGIPTERFRQFVNPGTGPLPKEIIELTGITDSDLRDAPPVASIARSFIDFVEDHDIVGHNVAFDLGFLRADSNLNPAFKVNQVALRTHDTNLLSRFIHPCLDSYGLRHLSTLFNTRQKPSHRAVEDAEATGELFAILVDILLRVQQADVAQALRFVEGTASPLRNTLRLALNAIAGGEIGSQVEPDALKGLQDNHDNVYFVSGTSFPEEPITSSQVCTLLKDTARCGSVIPDYEVRPQQVSMAGMVHQAVQEGSIIVAEAGTGVGKSLAYLVPALLSNKQSVIATHTKNLQGQLFYQEIPRLANLFNFGFKAVLLKGRSNYLCNTKWKNWASNPEKIAQPRLRENAALIVRWVSATSTGDINEVSSVRSGESDGFFNLVTSEPGYCLTRICSGEKECPFSFIRKEALNADLIVVNHSLVLADLDMEQGILNRAGLMVFDEAHHFEEVATEHYGTELSSLSMRGILERIIRNCRRNSELWILVSSNPLYEGLEVNLEKVASKAADLTRFVQGFFDSVAAPLRSLESHDAGYTLRVRYFQGDDIHHNMHEAGTSILDGLKALSTQTGKILQRLNEAPEEILPQYAMQELRTGAANLADCVNTLDISLNPDTGKRVHWIDLPQDIDRDIIIKTAPLDVAAVLHECLWQRLDSALLTSATLSTAPGQGGFKFIIGRLGLDRIEQTRLKTAAFGSPFDYQNNCLVCYASFLPGPAEFPDQFLEKTADLIAEIAVNQRQGMLCLFTSYKAMRSVNRRLQKSLLGSGLDVLVQAGGRGRERLIRRFRNSNGAVLLGTSSFWEGIDVPGPALGMVVIPRLPFHVPDDPVIAARIDQLRAEGRNPFFEFQIPAAVLRLRQGAGRLIRSTTDRGVIMIMDPRAVLKGYGLSFRKALPGSVKIVRSQNEMIERIERFFEDETP